MPDLGLTKAIRGAIKTGAKAARVLRPEEIELEASAAARKVSDDAQAAALQSADMQATRAPVVPEIEIPMAQAQDIDKIARETSDPKRMLQDYDLEASHQPNFDTWATDKDVQTTVADLALKQKDVIDEARRGVVTHERTQELADALDLDTDVVGKLLKREKGETLNPHELRAATQLVVSSAERLQFLQKKIVTGQASDMDRLMFRRQFQMHAQIFPSWMGARSEAGRTLNILRVKANMSPKQLALMKELAERMTGDTDELARMVGEIDSVQGISKLARQYTKHRFWNSATEVFVNSILSGPRTALVNVLGNGIYQAMNIAETAVAARIGRFMGTEEGVQAGEAAAMVHGTFAGVNDGLRLGWRAMKSGRTLEDQAKFATNDKRAITAENVLPEQYRNTPLGSFVNGLGAVIRAPTERVIGPTDEFFKTIAYRAELERQAFEHVAAQLSSGKIVAADAASVAKQFLEDAPLSAQEAAAEYGRRATFQNQLGPAGAKWERALRAHPTLAILAPFIRTPVNIFKAGILERSPVAVFTGKFWRDMKAGGRTRDMALARVTMGSMTSGLIAYQTLQGNVTGGGPQNQSARGLLEKRGWKPYSIRWYNPVLKNYEYTSYARLEPLAFVIGATADTAEIASFINSDPETLEDEDQRTSNVVAAIVAGIANNTMSKTFTKGLADFSEMMSDPKRYTQQWAGNMATAFVPYSAMRKQIGQIEDPYMREAWTLLDKMRTQSGIPGYSEDAPPRRDVYGEPRKYAAGDILGPMSPIPSSEESVDSINDELVRVMNSARIVPVTMPGKRVEGMRLNAQEYDDLVRISRTEPIIAGKRTFKDELERTMSSKAYLRATDTGRAELLRDVQNRADGIAADLMERPNPYQNIDFADRLAVHRADEIRLRTGK